MASGALRELIALFTIEVDPEGNLEKGEKKVGGFLSRLGEGAKIAAEVFAIHEIKEFIEGTVEAGARVFDLSTRLGIATHDLQMFQFAGKLVGVEGEQMAMILGHLNRSVGEVVTGLGGGEVAKAFAALKISVKDANGAVKPMPELLGDVAEKIAAIPEQSKRAVYAQQLFGRQGQALLPILAQGREGLKKLGEEFDELGGGMSDDFVKKAKEVDDETQKLSLGWTSLKTIIAGELLPPIMTIVDWFIRMTKATIALTKDTHILQTAMVFLGGFAVLKVVNGLQSLLGVLGVLQPSILGTVKSLFLFAAPAIVLLGLYLIFDDLFTLMKGGKSTIGDVLDSLFGLGTAAAFAQDLVDIWGHFVSMLETTGDLLGNVATIVVDVLDAAFKQALGTVSGIGDALNKLAHGDLAGASAAFKGALTQPVDGKDAAAVRAAGRDIGRDLSGNRPGSYSSGDQGANVNSRYLGPGGAWRQGAGARDPGGAGRVKVGHIMLTHGALPEGGAAAGHVLHQHNETNVIVHTASDQPRAVGQAVGQGVATSQQRANANAYAAVRKP